MTNANYKTTWSNVCAGISKYMVRVEVRGSFGSGFFVYKNKNFLFFATAHHVVSNAQRWNDPIILGHRFIENDASLLKNIRIDKPNIILYPNDVALIIVNRKEGGLDWVESVFGDLDSPELLPNDHSVRCGAEVSWAGFPCIVGSGDVLCHFFGHVSNIDVAYRLQNPFARYYLVDGNAINGVSGGPAYIGKSEQTPHPVIWGVVSAYVPNKQQHGTLPGLSVIRPLGEIYQQIQNLMTRDDIERMRKENEMLSQDTEGVT